MSEYPPYPRPIVFLHLPRTGGQTIHHAIGAIVGGRNISPYRLTNQVKDGVIFPPGYRMHSGHLDWTDLEQVAGHPFSFMVFRDPREWLGSFFFFMRDEAQRAQAQQGQEALTPVQMALLRSAPALFFSEVPDVRNRVDALWTNATLSYLATRSLRRTRSMQALPLDELLAMAEANSAALSAIYRLGEFSKLEDDIEALLGARPKIVGNHHNAGSLRPSQSRWEALLDEMETEAQRREMDRFVEQDMALMERITFR